jgi:hypothetical protein
MFLSHDVALYQQDDCCLMQSLATERQTSNGWDAYLPVTQFP